MSDASLVDLRSDTVTQPTPEMRRAIAEAPVGDDVLGDDPTVKRLEARVADLLGKEAAVYVPSGSMANQAAIRAHTEPGDEILIAEDAHLFLFEAGAPSALSGVSCNLLHANRGMFTAATLQQAIRPRNQHFPHPRLVCLENTSNAGGGSVWPLEQVLAVAAVARDNDLQLHLDGARLWNAAAASGMAERDLAAPFDSVSVCFSKGLGAPVGSAICGSAAFIDRCRRFRKMFGGAMRQAGIIAAGALHALEHHRDRLADDHRNAKRLARGLAALPGVRINVDDVETNIVYFELEQMPAAEFLAALQDDGVLMLSPGTRIRAVTNLMVDEAGIDRALASARKALNG